MHARSIGLICLLALALLPSASHAARKAPNAKPGASSYFIFGYGSLLNTASTAKTNCGLSGFAEGDLDGLMALFEKASPAGSGLKKYLKKCQVQGQRVVRVSGLQRGWNFQQGEEMETHQAEIM